MTSKMSEEEIYQRARKRVEDKKGLLIHAIIYAVVNAMLITIWALTGGGYPWFWWPLAGWGVGLIFNFLGVFVFDREMSWENRAVEKEAKRIRDSQK